MALSDQAIGFFLEVEDISLSRTLKSATKSYDQYVSALEDYNKRAFESSSKGLAQITQLVQAVENMPVATAKAMKKASATIEKQLKPITQKIDLAISVSSANKLKKVIGSAVGDAMSDARVRLSASLPQRRLSYFQQGVGLRAQYTDIPQPPDMRGKIQPLKKYNKGGVVDGPPGIDKVFAMLTKGEMVLPADVTKKLASAGGRALKTGTVDPKDVQELVDLTATYGDELQDVNEQFAFLSENLDNLTDVTKARLGGAMLQSVKRTKELEEVADGAGNKLKRLLVDILGPARFLAISQGMSDLRDGINDLRSGAGSAFTTLGGDEIGSGIDSINQMNQFLGVSRAELLEIKIRAGQVAKEVDGISFDELGFALKEVADLGVRDEEIMFRLAKTSALAAKGMDIAAESAANMGFELTESLNVSEEGFDAVIATMGKLSDRTAGFNISAGKLFEQTNADVEVLNTSLREMSDEESQRLIGSFNQIGAVLESTFIQNAGEIRQTLAKAFEGGPENMEAIATATQLTGLAQDELRAKLQSGDLEGIFDRIGQQVQGMSPDQIKALSSAIGVSSGELGKFGSELDSVNEMFTTSQGRIVKTGEGMDILEERARNNRSAFEKLQETFTDNVSAMTVFGISGAEVLDFFKEFNLTSLASIAILGKTALSALGTAKSFLGLGGAQAAAGQTAASTGGILAKLGPLLGKIAMTAGPILLVGAAVGFLTMKAIDFMEETNAINKETAEKGDKLALTEFGALGHDIQRVRKNIGRVQESIDLDRAAGQEISPAKISLIERYTAQLEGLEAQSKGMVDAAKARKGLGNETAGMPGMPQIPGMENMPTDFSFDASTFTPPVAPVTADELAGIMPDPVSTERQEKLLERMVALQEETLRATREGNTPANPSPTVQGPSTGVSSFGQSVAGGDF